jgi:hypothetical protein
MARPILSSASKLQKTAARLPRATASMWLFKLQTGRQSGDFTRPQSKTAAPTKGLQVSETNTTRTITALLCGTWTAIKSRQSHIPREKAFSGCPASDWVDEFWLIEMGGGIFASSFHVETQFPAQCEACGPQASPRGAAQPRRRPFAILPGAQTHFHFMSVAPLPIVVRDLPSRRDPRAGRIDHDDFANFALCNADVLVGTFRRAGGRRAR